MNASTNSQVVMITGGSTGIGAAAALGFAKAGSQVLITGRNEASLRESAARHENISYVVADVSRSEDVARSIDEVKRRYGRLDVLVNNAGVWGIAPLAYASSEHIRETFEINVVGPIETTRQALPLLRESKGAIVNVSSIAADNPMPNMSVYSASKAAILALTRAWARELAADGIRVNAVSPGPVETPIFSPEKLRIPAEQISQLAAAIPQMIPMSRFGSVDEVAPVILFLASKAASFVTGAQYSVAGGMEA